MKTPARARKKGNGKPLQPQREFGFAIPTLLKVSYMEKLRLPQIVERLWGKKDARSWSQMAETLLQVAIAHYDVIEPYIFADIDYAHAEGLDTETYVLSKIQAAILSHKTKRFGTKDLSES